MNTQNKFARTLIVAIITAITASLCCMTPVLAVLAGISGVASAFSWLEPLRPYLIGLTIIILGFAWYQKLKPREREKLACECETDKKPSFVQSKKFLTIVTILAGLLVTFPYYFTIFFRYSNTNTVIVERENIALATIKIDGMTCTGCELSVNKALNDLSGVLKVESDFRTGIAKVKYDKTKVSSLSFRKAIEETVGYKVIDIVIGGEK